MEFHSERAAAGLGPSGLSLRKLPDRVVLRLQIVDYIAEEEVTRSPQSQQKLFLHNPASLIFTSETLSHVVRSAIKARKES